MLAKFILPWFGGSAAVWSSALLFFQLVLLAGYFYAHLLIKFVRPRIQFVVHAALLAVSLATLPIVPAARWKPPIGAGDPAPQILLLLAATVGLPYMLLSATSPLLQAWYARTRPGAIPYRLFALSNFGSMLALVSYPFWFEPNLTLGSQAGVWSIAYGVFAVACALAGWRSRSGESEESVAAQVPRPSASEIALWIGFAMCASTLLLAVTSHLTQNVAPIPLLWIVPLSLYLLSFILTFESSRFYHRIIYLPLLIAALAVLAWGDSLFENNAELNKLIPALCAALFICCMVCHGEVAARKPHPRHLTLFYLMISVGGAAGGLFVALLAPRVFKGYWELPIGMFACALLVTLVMFRVGIRVGVRVGIRVGFSLATIAFGVYLVKVEIDKNREYVFSARNFYGVLHVRDHLTEPGMPGFTPRRILVHGTISHGTQLLTPNSDRIPTSYFDEGSGISKAIHVKGEAGPIRIGILGLGAGVTATLARAGDTIHYYELNPLVLEIASRDFGFLKACPASKQVFLGDGRLVLENLPDEQLDVLAIDAFSSDSIPIHLLTREAFAIYLRHVKPDGVLVIHVTNRFLDLEPVVAKAADEAGMTGLYVADQDYLHDYDSPSNWVILSHSATIFRHATFQDGTSDKLRIRAKFRTWTDDYSNLIEILR